jgi:hypothetical protein
MRPFIHLHDEEKEKNRRIKRRKKDKVHPVSYAVRKMDEKGDGGHKGDMHK